MIIKGALSVGTFWYGHQALKYNIEREIFSVSVSLPVLWAHHRVYRPCAGLRCGIPLSDYCLLLSPHPHTHTFRLSPCASNRVETDVSPGHWGDGEAEKEERVKRGMPF